MKLPLLNDVLKLIYLLFAAIVFAIGYGIFEGNISLKETLSNKPMGCGTIAQFGDGYDGSSSIEEGKRLFKTYCATCHAKNLKVDATGPALNRFFENWQKDTTRIRAYLSDSRAYLETYNDARIAKIRTEFKSTANNHFFPLSKVELAHLLSYIELTSS